MRQEKINSPPVDSDILPSPIGDQARTGDAASLRPPVSATQENSAELELRRRHAGKRVLLAKDPTATRESALSLIQACGLVADTAENGLEAVAKSAETSYDLILLDIRMPKMNGLDASRAIRALPGRQATPILAMTASTFDEARQACRDAGMNDLVAKPFNPHDFYASLLNWLGTQNAPEQSVPIAPDHRVGSSEEQQQWLSQLPGLELDSGLATMRGDVTKYLRVLGLFADDCQRHAAQLSAMLAGTEFAALEPIACSLRGSAAMLGARAISEAADAVVAACRKDADQPSIAPLCAALANEMSGLANAIRRATPETAESIEAEARPEQIEEVLARLAALLEQGNIRAGYLAREEAAIVHATFGESAGAFLARIDVFDFDAALADLRQARARRNDGTNRT